MANLFYIMGKSSTGKDTIYKRIKQEIDIKEYVLYTTRPMRDGEKEGVDYYYVSNEQMQNLKMQGKVIESRTYQTVKGPWTYATISDSQFEIDKDMLMLGTLESYIKVKENFEGNENIDLIPIYIEVPDNIRLKRAIEESQGIENYDYFVINDDLEACVDQVHSIIGNEHFRSSRSLFIKIETSSSAA